MSEALRIGVPVERLASVTALYRDYVAGRESPVHRYLNGFGADADAWRSALGARRPVDGRLLERIRAGNAALGASPGMLERLRGLADGSTRAVVTGQQPGVIGGPLLSLHKAATAVALAREIETRWKTPCVALFWLGSDDDDFAETRELALVSDALAVVSVALDAAAHAPGRRIGDIAGSAVARAWEAVAAFLPANEGAHEVAARVAAMVRSGDDLGSVAARVLSALTNGEMAVLDCREPALREAGRETVFEFFDREEAIQSTVRATGEALVADGYHAQLAPGSDSGLFLVREGIRQRIPAGARAAARAELARDVTAASPGVVARNLIQDAVFAPVAVVLGPAEIAYRAQLGSVYDALGIGRPVAFPRLAGTFVPPPARDLARASHVDAALLAVDAAAWVVQVTQSLESARVREAAREFEAAFRAQGERFVAAAGERLDARARDKLARRMADLAHRAASIVQGAVEQDALAGASAWPWLARAAELFARDGVAQERYLSALVPHTFLGGEAWPLVTDVAGDHVREALDGRVLHRVYSR